MSVTLYLLQRLRDYLLSLSPPSPPLTTSSSSSFDILPIPSSPYPPSAPLPSSPPSTSSFSSSDPLSTIIWTTTNVCSLLIKPWTERSQCSFQQFMKDSYEDIPHPQLALGYQEGFSTHLPEYFISHAWQYQYVEVVESLELYFQKIKPNYNSKEIYLWFDLFLNDQWNAPNRTFEWWSTTFLQAVGDIGNTLLVLLPWKNPIPLRRAWCLWEIHCTRITGSNFSIVLSSEQKKSLHETLRTDFDDIIKQLCKINVEESEAFLVEDRDQIFAAVKSTNGGFASINRDISSLIREWLRHTSEALLLNQEITPTSSPEEIVQILCDERRYGSILYDQGKFIEAADWFKQVSDKQRHHLGSQHLETLKTLTLLANSLAQLDQLESAIELCDKLIEGYKSHESLSRSTILSIYSNKAAMMKNLGKNEEALLLLRETLEIAEQDEMMGSNHQDTMSIVFNIGMILSTQGYYEEAKSHFLRTISVN
jgi:tetratricopeptide (TPR) repeat protein